MKRFASLIFLLSLSVSADWRGYFIGQGVATGPTFKNSSEDLGSFRIQNINRANGFFSNDFASYEVGLQLTQSYDYVKDHLQVINYKKSNRSYRVADLNETWLTTNAGELESYTLIPNLDRFMLSKNFGEWQGTFGRQMIAFGSSKTSNPIDVIVPFDIAEVNTEESSGVDAIRFRHPLGDLGQWDFGAIIGEDAKLANSSYYGTFRYASSTYEVQPIAMYFKEAMMLGFDGIYTLFGANFSLEASHVKPKDEGSYFRLTTGAEYQLNEDTTLNLEYHYNGAGVADIRNFTELTSQFAITDGGVFFVGRHYLNGYFAYQAHPLHNISTVFFTNLTDGSILLGPLWDWSLKDELVLNIGGFLGIGPRSESLTDIRSEFGLRGETAFVKLRQFF